VFARLPPPPTSPLLFRSLLSLTLRLVLPESGRRRWRWWRRRHQRTAATISSLDEDDDDDDDDDDGDEEEERSEKPRIFFVENCREAARE
jgi:hypothetical protein